MKRACVIGMIVMAVTLSVAVMPSSAQEDWPEECRLPDLEEAMSAASEAQANGDIVAYLDSLSGIADAAHNTYIGCFGEVARSGANLAGADLRNAHLQEADLRNANLQGADLTGAHLQEAAFWNANLQEADLTDADLQEAWLAGANLQGARLRNANLQEAYLSAFFEAPVADLEGADLTGANLEKANLSGVNLEGADLTDAKFGETTVLPDADCEWGQEQIVCDSYWTPDTDMARFTDPEHPDFWNPCVELDDPHWHFRCPR